ncbi:MAG: DUF3131 domain-containing protein [Clostridia bacterium]|nr:DUF3131 domain-containing protein [Clostridia bacterium]
MNSVKNAEENLRKYSLIRKFEKNMKAANEYAENMEHASDALLFAKANAPIVFMHLKNASRELKNVSLRGFLYNWAKELILGGKENIAKETLFQSLSLLDEEKSLTSAEFLNIGNLLVYVCARLFSELMSESNEIQKQRMLAECWIEDKKRAASDGDEIFFLEHALKLSRDNDDAEKISAVQKQLEYIAKTEEEVIEIASRTLSDLLLRMTNAVNLIHLCVNIHWLDVNESLSHTEKILKDDPKKIYSNMDEESKAQIRKSIEEISFSAGFSERSAAAVALEMVKKGEFQDITHALYTDFGRESVLRELNPKGKMRQKLFPDPDGRRLIAFQLAGTGLIFGASIRFIPLIASIIALPMIWAIVTDLMRFLAAKRLKTHPLLSLDIKSVSDEDRTLVVIPALLTDADAALQIVNRLWEHGVHEKDQNVDFLLLGDYKDSKEAENETDAEINRAVRQGIETINVSSERKKYFYLSRARTFNEDDKIWMGRERKRGAIEDLNRLIVTGENRFTEKGEDAQRFYGRYTYLITLDSDTRILPGEIKKLIGMISHPLNKEYSIIQPRMETIPSEKRNVFSEIMSGVGGTDHYDICASDFYQDLTGEGLFSGKGIIRIEKFFLSTVDAFSDNTVLSHDMIEGIVAKAAYAGNRQMFESFPESIEGFLKRLDRWTRGDWQLLYYLFGRISLNGLGRFKIVSNILRSLKSASVLSAIALGFWFEETGLIAFSILAHFLPVFLNGFSAFSACFMNFALLPSIAWTEIRASVTALIRIYITKRKRLEWVTAAERIKNEGGINKIGIFYSLFLIPGLFQKGTIFLSLFLSLIFSFSREAIRYVQSIDSSERMKSSDYAYLSDLARSIWKYFEKFVPLDGNGLPPDNVQLDPPVGIQNRTSPTNIGMYILSVIGANALSLIDREEAIGRLKQTLNALKKLETYNGLYYNWYDIQTLEAVHPKYISSVDFGNLLAAFITARNFLCPDHIELSNAYQSLIDSSDLSILYNEDKKLFRIGYDAENHVKSASHYDLFASEARILSYAAMAEKGISISHWKRLGRPFAFIHAKPVVLSWSGTMFEYMMPNLLMASTSRSMINQTEKAIIHLQMRNAKNGVWGISESGFAAFDRELNYQYRAFGLANLALSSEATGRVYSPYSALLSLAHAKEDAVTNLQNMQKMGLRGDFGFYEAVDLTKEDHAQIVYSYMTHHQGMSFISIVNELTNNSIKHLFLCHPKEASLKPLLSEKPFVAPIRRKLFSRDERNGFENKEGTRFQKPGEYARSGNIRLNEGHLLFAGDTNAYFEPNGRSFLRRGRIYANFYSCDMFSPSETLLPVIENESGRANIKRVLFDTGYVKYELSNEMIKACVSFTLNPENGRMLIKTEVESCSKSETDVTVEHAFRIALSGEDMMNAHPVFSDLFIREEGIDDFGKIYFRKDRDTLKENVCLLHMSDRKAHGEKRKLHARTASLKREIHLKSFQKEEMYFEIGIQDEKDEKMNPPTGNVFDRSIILLRAQMNAHIQFCGLKAAEYRQIDRMTANLYSLSAKNGAERYNPKALWPLGISGDTPILLSEVTQKSSLIALKKLIRAHEFYRYAGVHLPLVVLCVRETEYFAPFKDAIRSILSSSHLANLNNDPSGAIVFSMDEITEEQKKSIHTLAAMSVKTDFITDARPDKRTFLNENRIADQKILSTENKASLIKNNGYGGFLEDGSGYQIRLSPECIPPRRWSNFLTNDNFGVMTNELGIAHVYFQNSRMGRITPFENTLDQARSGVSLWAIENGKRLSLTPGLMPKGEYTVTVKPGETTYGVETELAKYETTCYTDVNKPVFYAKIEVQKKTEQSIEIQIFAYVRFLLGTDLRDLRFTKIEDREIGVYAHGKCDFSALAYFLGGTKEEGLKTKLSMYETQNASVIFVLNAYKTAPEIVDKAMAEDALFKMRGAIHEKFSAISVNTHDPARDTVVNGFMKAQTLFSRFYGRFGPYQPGGAFGMRDQLQDLLSIMYMDQALSRSHLLYCASKQFERGDGLHWWHMPSSGVRTRISDDILFLPYVTAKYISQFGDREILCVHAPYLSDFEIPQDREDIYREFEETKFSEPLYEHIMRAFKYVNRRGSHGLLLMGAGDWNDGMNKIGHKGKGESVWLSEFFLYTSEAFMPYAKDEDKLYLENANRTLREAIETHAWDGEWYLRAFDDDGNKIGSKDLAECRIDLISQAWAVIAGLDKERAIKALKSAKAHLVDSNTGLICLLTPPFTGKECHPGYISAYPCGIRENGGQYTHAACWLVKAYASLGMAQEAWAAFDMLLPISRSDTKEKADKYGGEPYVVSADISANTESLGACGWTWYTGAAAWAQRILIEDLLGVEIIGNKVKMHALLPAGAESMACTIKKGTSEYTLVAKRETNETERTIDLIDDGKAHIYEFPARR